MGARPRMGEPNWATTRRQSYPVDHVEPVLRRVRRRRPTRLSSTPPRRSTSGSGPTIPSSTSRSDDVNRDLLIDEHHAQCVHRGHTQLIGGGPSATTRSRAPCRVDDDSFSPASPGRLASSGARWTAGSRRTRRSSSIRGAPTAGRRAALHPVGAGRARRCHPRRVLLAGDGVRDRSADPLLPQPDRGQLRPPARPRPSPRAPTKGRPAITGRCVVEGTVHPDLAWSYDFPTGQLSPIAGLISFYNEKVDIILDGAGPPRPQTHFSK